MRGPTKQEFKMGNPVVWFEVIGNDGGKLREFYGGLFGWTFKDVPEMDYGMTESEQTGIPGGVGKAPAGPGWATFYVDVPDLEASLAKATEQGAKVLMPPTPLPDGKIAVFADPEGHPIGLHQSTAA